MKKKLRFFHLFIALNSGFVQHFFFTMNISFSRLLSLSCHLSLGVGAPLSIHGWFYIFPNFCCCFVLVLCCDVNWMRARERNIHKSTRAWAIDERQNVFEKSNVPMVVVNRRGCAMPLHKMLMLKNENCHFDWTIKAEAIVSMAQKCGTDVAIVWKMQLTDGKCYYFTFLHCILRPYTHTHTPTHKIVYFCHRMSDAVKSVDAMNFPFFFFGFFFWRMSSSPMRPI